MSKDWTHICIHVYKSWWNMQEIYTPEKINQLCVYVGGVPIPFSYVGMHAKRHLTEQLFIIMHSFKIRSLDVLRFPNNHSNKCETYQLHREHFRSRLKFHLHSDCYIHQIVKSARVCRRGQFLGLWYIYTVCVEWFTWALLYVWTKSSKIWIAKDRERARRGWVPVGR